MSRLPAAALLSALMFAACSPEAARTRGSGPGGDTGNRPAIVRMHEGSRPFHDTPRVIAAETPPLDAASQAREYGRR